jgi:hypothetical protein
MIRQAPAAVCASTVPDNNNYHNESRRDHHGGFSVNGETDSSWTWKVSGYASTKPPICHGLLRRTTTLFGDFGRTLIPAFF